MCCAVLFANSAEAVVTNDSIQTASESTKQAVPGERFNIKQLIGIAKEVEQRVAGIRGKKLKVAVMGCAVNGPGEAREADLGIAGGDGVGLIFRKGEILRKVPQERLVDELMIEINNY